MDKDISLVIVVVHNLPLVRTRHYSRLSIERCEGSTLPSRSSTPPVLVLCQVEGLRRKHACLIHIGSLSAFYAGGRTAPCVDVVALGIAVGSLVAVSRERGCVPPEALVAEPSFNSWDPKGC
jgi:hypothetical protein